MNCLEFRRTLATEPGCTTAAFIVHRDTCPGCARAARDAAGFESRLARAVSVQPPADLERRILLRQAFSPRRIRLRRLRPQLAAAAALLLAFVAGVMVTGVASKHSLEQAVLHHVALEAHAPPPEGGVDADTVAMMLAAIGIHMDETPGEVRAAGLCAVRERTVAHLLFGSGDSQLDVLVMPGESLPGRRRIGDGTREGMMLPVEGGVLALLGPPGAPAEDLAYRLRHGLRLQQ